MLRNYIDEHVYSSVDLNRFEIGMLSLIVNDPWKPPFSARGLLRYHLFRAVKQQINLKLKIHNFN